VSSRDVVVRCSLLVTSTFQHKSGVETNTETLSKAIRLIATAFNLRGSSKSTYSFQFKFHQFLKMGGGSLAKQYPYEYLTAAGMAACLNYPLWRASAVGQSGFSVASIHIGGVGKVPAALSPYVHAFAPPYKGMMSVVLGMTWARAAIFWGSDSGKDLMKNSGIQNESITTVLPTLMVSTLVQCVNQPLVRASVTLQNPKFDCPDTRSALRYIYKQYGWKGLWHGTSAGILKTVPKYCTAICVKDYIEVHYPASSDASDSDRLWRSAAKSACAGVAGAALSKSFDHCIFWSCKRVKIPSYLEHKPNLLFIKIFLDQQILWTSYEMKCSSAIRH